MHTRVAFSRVCRYHAKMTAFEMGSSAPVVHRITTAMDANGQLQAIDADIYFDSSQRDMLLVLEASTPLGTGKIEARLSKQLARCPQQRSSRVSTRCRRGRAAGTAFVSASSAHKCACATRMHSVLSCYHQRMACRVSFAQSTQCMQITGIRIAGTIRLIPIPENNFITFSFAYPPQIGLDVKAAVGGLGAQVGKSAILRRAISNVLTRRFTEPRRRMLVQYLRPAKFPDILKQFMSAVVTVSVQSIAFAATHERDVVVHAQMRKVCFQQTACVRM